MTEYVISKASYLLWEPLIIRYHYDPESGYKSILSIESDEFDQESRDAVNFLIKEKYDLIKSELESQINGTLKTHQQIMDYYGNN